MNDEIKTLYKLKTRLAADFEAATAAMPEKKALDHAVSLIAHLESQQRPPERDSEKVVHLRTKKPRTLVSDKQKKVILDWLCRYFRTRNNQPVSFRQLTDLMLAEGITVPGSSDKQIFVVSGLVTRNKMFKGKDGRWHLAEFAA